MKFKINKTVFEKFPNIVEVIPIVTGFNAKKDGATVLERLRLAEKNIKDKFKEGWIDTIDFRLYVDTFAGFGAPGAWLPSHAALTARVMEGKQIPDINPVVNFYNSYSLENSVPFGGENLSKVVGDMELTIARGGETWWGMGEKKNKPAVVGELIWKDNQSITCRAWNWRQCERTKLTEDIENGYFIMDGFESNREKLVEVAESFIKEFLEIFGGQAIVLVLDKNNPEGEIDFESKNEEINEGVKKVEKKKVETKFYESEIVKQIKKWVMEITGIEAAVEHPSDNKFGDYTTNMVMVLMNVKELSEKSGTYNLLSENGEIKYERPANLAEEIKKRLEPVIDKDIIEKIEVAGNGYINFYLKTEYLINKIGQMGISKYWSGKRIMVEFAHPNTHKELHIGHMRTLITGESLARIFEAVGATVFRANYQGDIGPHVAKAIWGVRKLSEKENVPLSDWENKSSSEKAHFLGRGYAYGSAAYEENKAEIDELNQKLYESGRAGVPDYELTRRWSLDYYDEFYRRFGTKFDKLFFEGEIADEGKRITESLVGSVLIRSEGAIIFDGEKYGLHKRVFETALGTPTYEGKELGLAYAQKKAFEYDKNIHVVANEQSGYFKVVIKAMELMDKWFEGRQYHLPMGMVTLVGKKMSSRTGEVLTVDNLLDEVKMSLEPLFTHSDLAKAELERVTEIVTIGAVKFSVLRPNPTQNSVFDIKKSVSIDGDSGPYLQYTYARCQSVLGKTKIAEQKNIENVPAKLEVEELALLRELFKFEEKITEAAERFNPAIMAEYLISIARKYNEFYGKYRIIDQAEEVWRIFLTKSTASVLKTGLGLLGIGTVEKM